MAPTRPAALLVSALLLHGGCVGKPDVIPGGPDGGDDPGADAAPPADAYVPPTEFDMHRLLEESDIFGGEEIATGHVQEFLDMHGSFLAGYRDPMSGRSAAAIIVERSHAYGVSPLYMLARIQTESGLISSGSSNNLDAATGCGCPDGSGCNPELGGFGNQIECAALKMRGYMDDLDAGRPTIAGWSVGVSKNTGDPCAVRPENKATAALYTYTPWVGAYASQCGRADVGGSSLVAVIYHRFLSQYPWGIGP